MIPLVFLLRGAWQSGRAAFLPDERGKRCAHVCRHDGEGKFKRTKHSAEHGFTLVELMVVITLIALMSAAVVLTVPDPRQRVVEDAERFAARASAVRDLAIIEARPTGLWVGTDGYGFERRIGRQWIAIGDKPFAPQRWKDGNSALVSEDRRERILFDPMGMPDKPLVLRLVGNGQAVSIAIQGDGRTRVGG